MNIGEVHAILFLDTFRGHVVLFTALKCSILKRIAILDFSPQLAFTTKRRKFQNKIFSKSFIESYKALI